MAYWKCEKGHTWKARINDRCNKNKGCPVCSNRKLLVGTNDLGTLFPEIKLHWDYEKNTKRPEDFLGRNSTSKVWFECLRCHESYMATINSFNRGSRCPFCAGKKVKEGLNDLATTHPHLAEEWDYRSNGDRRPQNVTHGSDEKVWWICNKGHTWRAAISSRAGGSGCPVCQKESQISLSEKTFAFYLSRSFPDLIENVRLPELGKKELDIYVPSLRLAVEYDGHQFHRNQKKDLAKDALCAKNGITLIRIREEGCPKYESNAYFIDSPENKGDVMKLHSALNELINLINRLFNMTIAPIVSIEDDLGAINESFFSSIKANSLGSKCPELLKEWHPTKNGTLNPELVSCGTDKKVWWLCDKGHEWTATVASRVAGNGCPYCYGRKVQPGFNDLASQFPELVDEWDYESNKRIDPHSIYYGSNKVVTWKCAKGHTWKTKISQRSWQKTGCPKCKGREAIPGENDLATLRPDLAEGWDYERNGLLMPNSVPLGSEKKVWWICPKGHRYCTQVAIRAKMGCGCPVCSGRITVTGYNDLQTLHPELAKEWDYEKNGELLPTKVGGGGGSHKRIWWKCAEGHSWEASLASRIGKHSGCPQCAINKRKKK